MIDHDDYTKFKVTIQGSKRKNILVSFIQDWIKKSGSKKQNQIVELHIYTYDKNSEVILIVKTEMNTNVSCFETFFFNSKIDVDVFQSITV